MSQEFVPEPPVPDEFPLRSRVRITKPSEVPGAVVLSLTTPASWEDFQGFMKAVEALQGDGFVVRSVESSYKLFRVWLRRDEE